MLLALQVGRNNEKKSAGIVILPDMLWLRDQRVIGATIVFEEDQLVFEFPSGSIANDRFERCRISISNVEELIQPPPLNFAEVSFSRSNRTPPPSDPYSSPSFHILRHLQESLMMTSKEKQVLNVPE